MRARRRFKNKAKDQITKYSERIFIDSSTYQKNTRPDLKKRLQKAIKKHKKTIFLEIGMGNGQFLNELAKRHPEMLCIGVELKEERILEAIQEAKEKNIKNTLILKISALHLNEIFLEQQIDTIFVNFPDPWPKKRHIKHRLMAPHFLETYHHILKKDEEIILKTDNPIMYEYSLETLPEHFTILKTLENLSRSEENIETKYERRYRHEEKNIYKIIAQK